MNRPIKVLLLDDDLSDIKFDLEMSAKSNRVVIKEAFTNAEEGTEYIKSHHADIDAIILDGFFMADPSSSRKKDITALKATVDELNKLLYRENIRIPFCVLTGYLEDISQDSILSDVKVFRKGQNPQDMFNYLKNEVGKNEEYQIKNEFDKVFELFDKKLLPKDKESDLVEILKKLKNKAKYNDDDAFNPIRKMYEAIVDSLYDETFALNKQQDIVHIDLFNKNDELKISWSFHYLSGRDVKLNAGKVDEKTVIDHRGEAVWPAHVESAVDYILKVSNPNSHDYPEDVHHYTYKSVVYALLELMLWYKEFITNYKKEHTDA